MNEHNKGIDLHRFTVTRTDGSSVLGGKHDGCRYFVLDLDHDPFSRAAIIAYAEDCENSFPELAADLQDIAVALCCGENLPEVSE